MRLLGPGRIWGRCFALGCILLSLAGCASLQNYFEPPTVSLIGIEILEADGFSIRFGLDLTVQNPNPITIPISGLSLNGNEVLSGVSSTGIDLGA